MGDEANRESDEKQTAAILGCGCVAENFHEPIINNFVQVLVSRRNDLDRHLELSRDATASLNVADVGLLAVCQGIADDLRQQGRNVQPLDAALSDWRERLESHQNLLAANAALAFVGAYRRFGSLQDRLIREHPRVVDRFRSVTPELVEFVRLNLFLPFDLVTPTLNALCMMRTCALESIDRVEIARYFGREKAQGVQPFPTLILYLGMHAPRPGPSALASLFQAVRQLTASMGDLRAPPMMLTDYAVPLFPLASVTQGYRLHKRYLAAIGLVGELFDQRNGYALIRPDRAGDRPFSEATRTAISALR